jgi:hypothetical protein
MEVDKYKLKTTFQLKALAMCQQLSLYTIPVGNNVAYYS